MEDPPIDRDELQEIIGEFITESIELVETASADLLTLEKEPSGQTINSVFRAVHNIKGTAGFLGFETLSSLAHRSEDVLGKLRKGELSLSPSIITTLLKTLDVMRLLIEDIGAGGKEARNLSGLLLELESIVAGVVRDGTDRGAREPRPERGVCLPEGAQAAGAAKDDEASGAALAANHASSRREQTVRVEVKKLDELMNLVGELVLGKNRLTVLGALFRERAAIAETEGLAELTNQIEMITNDLQATVMKARLVPIAKLFNTVPRLVRELCSASGKDIELKIEGGETELDKSLIETLHDPLTHIMRNSIDHGIETPEERERAGKPRKGLISVKARSEGNQVVVEVWDDGRGINLEAIRRKAAERGLLSRAQADSISVQEATNLIFIPGLSTARVLSPVSGRGVGMDVVKTNIEKVNGHVSVSSAKGKWTKLTIQLPLTLAIMKALLVSVKAELYAIPLSGVLEVVRPRQGFIKKVGGQEALVLRGAIIPVLRLSRVFAVRGEAEEHGVVVVCRVSDRPVGLMVGSVIGQEEVVIKSLGEFLRSVRWVAGATIRGDGRVALILDLAAIVADSLRKRGAA